MLQRLKRTIKNAWKLFLRNGEISSLNVLVLTLAVSLLSLGLVAEKLLNFLVLKIQEKADISIYFKEEVGEEEILKLKEAINALPGVERITFISKEEAFNQFVQRHQHNVEIIDALKEVGNPFLASLSIKVKDPGQFENLLSFLEPQKEMIEKVDYFQRKEAIEKLFNLSNTIKKTFYLLVIAASVLTIFIVFVTTQLSLLNYREEINIQKLVGATPWMIRAPFLFEAIFLGIFSSFLSLFLLSLFFFFISPKLENFLLGLKLFEIWKELLPLALILNLASGTLLAMIASFFSLERCLKK